MAKFEIEIPETIQNYLETLKDISIDGINCKGGNGYIFFGDHKIMKKRIALKFYYYIDNLHPEVETLSSLRHKNIINVLDARSIGDGWAFFMTPEVKNGDLDDLIISKICLKKSIKYTRDILDGLTILHNQPYRIVHRDLKPSNILVDSSENALIGDFGSIKKIEEDQLCTNASRHTILYKPFESFNNQYFFSSDIYQVGVILFQLIGGTFPYIFDNWLSASDIKRLEKIGDPCEQSIFIDEVIRKKITNNSLLDFSSLPLYTPNGIKKIIKKATTSKIQTRYQNTAEFMLALHNYGEVPNWNDYSGHYHLENWKGKDYRIVPKGVNYICEFKKSSVTSWRKKSDIEPGSFEDVTHRTNTICGIA